MPEHRDVENSQREMVETYVRAWNAPDEAECRRLLEISWADGATYTDPSVQLEGRAALVEHCQRLAQRRGAAQIVITGDVDAHHGMARFTWAVRGADGSELRAGIDFAEFGADGRLSRIIGFFDQSVQVSDWPERARP